MKLKHVKLGNKVFMGLFSLLFILSVANTSAILNMTEPAVSNQSAQISLANPNCLEVTPRYNRDDLMLFSYPGSSAASGSYLFRMIFTVKNKCNRTVHVINSHNNNPVYVKLQTLDSSGQPVDLTDTSAFIIDQDGPACSSVSPACPDTWHSAVINGSNAYIQTVPLTPNQVRDVVLHVSILDSSNPFFGTYPTFRVTLDKMQYFLDQALFDGVVQSSELKTHTFSSSQQNLLATDYVGLLTNVNNPEMSTGDLSKFGLPKEMLEVLEKRMSQMKSEELIKLEKEKSSAVMPSSSGVRR